MLEIILIILVLIAIIFMIIAFYERDPVFALVSSVVWFICSLGSLEIEIPWEMYNVSSSRIETGLHTINPTGEAYLFLLLGVVMFISFTTLVYFTAFGKK